MSNQLHDIFDNFPVDPGFSALESSTSELDQLLDWSMVQSHPGDHLGSGSTVVLPAPVSKLSTAPGLVSISDGALPVSVSATLPLSDASCSAIGSSTTIMSNSVEHHPMDHTSTLDTSQHTVFMPLSLTAPLTSPAVPGNQLYIPHSIETGTTLEKQPRKTFPRIDKNRSSRRATQKRCMKKARAQQQKERFIGFLLKIGFDEHFL